MSGNPLFAQVHTADNDEHKAMTSSAAAIKSALEWGELVGFRRRYPSEVKQDIPQPVEATAEGIVVVGKGAFIIGEISNCSQVEIAVHGTIEGQIQVEDHLDIRATGDVSGELTYGKLSVASGGRLAGSVEIGAHARAREAAEQARSSAPRNGTADAYAASSFV